MTGPDGLGYTPPKQSSDTLSLCRREWPRRRFRHRYRHERPCDQPPIELPITGELDLHSFRPSELGELVPHYLRLCRERGLLEVRVVHGKGTGQVRASVHAILGRMPEVASFSLATPPFGGHGATIVRLRPPDSPEENLAKCAEPTAPPRVEVDPSTAN